MSALKTAISQMRSAASSVLGALAIISVLWFIREHHFNATNAGWGDQAQDRHQWLLGLGIYISATVALICTVITATTSRRALKPIAIGIALSSLAALATPWVPIVGFVLGFPGFVANLYSFGVHASAGYDLVAYALIVNAIAYGGIAFLLFLYRSKS